MDRNQERQTTYTELRFVAGGELPLGEGIWTVTTGRDAFSVASSVTTHL